MAVRGLGQQGLPTSPATAAGSKPRRRIAASSSILAPRTYSIVSTRRLDSRAMTRGTCSHGTCAKSAAVRCALRAWFGFGLGFWFWFGFWFGFGFGFGFGLGLGLGLG